MKISDLRNKSTDELSYILAGIGDRVPMLNAWQVSVVQKELPHDCVIVAPDFLRYARLISTGQASAVFSLPQDKAMVASALGKLVGYSAVHPLSVLRRDFWFVAKALLRYDLMLLPKNFRGHILLHPYLADFAFAFEKKQFMKDFFRRCSDYKPGIQTQQLMMALTCMSRWNIRPSLVVHSGTFDDSQMISPVMSANQNFKYVEFLHDFSYFPAIAQKQAKEGIFSI